MADERKMAACVGSRAPATFLFLVAVIHLIPCDVEGGLTLSKVCGEVPCKEHEFCSDFDRRCTECESVCEKSSHNFQEDVCHKDCQDYLHDMRYVRTGGDASTEDVGDLRTSVDRLTQLATASLAISVILLFVLSAFIFLVWLRSRRSSVSDGGESANRVQDDRVSYLHAKVASNKNPFKSDKNAAAAVSNTANGLKLDIAATIPGGAQQQTNSRQTPQPQAPLPPERTSASATTPGTAGGKSDATDVYTPPTTTSTPLSNRPPRYPSEDTTLDYAYDNRALTPSPRFEKGNGTVQHPPTPYHHPQQMGLGIKGETTF